MKPNLFSRYLLFGKICLRCVKHSHAICLNLRKWFSFHMYMNSQKMFAVFSSQAINVYCGHTLLPQNLPDQTQRPHFGFALVYFNHHHRSSNRLRPPTPHVWGPSSCGLDYLARLPTRAQIFGLHFLVYNSGYQSAVGPS